AATAVQDISLPTVTARALTVAVGHTPQSAGHDEQVSAMSQAPLGQRGGTGVGVGSPGASVGVGSVPGPQQP
ncbi:hypothetical protein KKG44_04285, partial [Patescibacteria group bacterium]|nr:hypothetical protein [Patescibacteria group bacterium]